MEYNEKFIAALILPPAGPILLALVGLLLARRWVRTGTVLVLLSLAGLWLLAAPAVSDALRLSLERRFPAVPVDDVPRAQAIVVLGGGIDPPHARNPHPDLNDAADRYWHAFRLWRAGKAPEILISGGALPWTDARSSEADAAVRFLVDLGVPARRVIVESTSLNTRQNANLSANVLRARGADRILLVTSALHMRRARALFEDQGLDVVPAATDQEVGNDPPGLLRWLPDTEALDGSRRALKEYLALWLEK
ncbi:MAG: YdcF family protein [Wenzhouxiangellaceae bacterium]|nr:YdcF family protein [Wenzhouxiangellaceae bacterium]